MSFRFPLVPLSHSECSYLECPKEIDIFVTSFFPFSLRSKRLEKDWSRAPPIKIHFTKFGSASRKSREKFATAIIKRRRKVRILVNLEKKTWISAWKGISNAVKQPPLRTSTLQIQFQQSRGITRIEMFPWRRVCTRAEIRRRATGRVRLSKVQVFPKSSMETHKTVTSEIYTRRYAMMAATVAVEKTNFTIPLLRVAFYSIYAKVCRVSFNYSVTCSFTSFELQN